MQRYNGQLINQFANVINGNAAAGALVTVKLKETGATVTLYAEDNLSGATLANPLTADAKGYYGFYAPDGVYTLDVSISGTPQLEIQLQDVAALQAQFDAALANAGYIPVGTFAAGCTVSQSNGVVSDGSSFWRWDGALPKTVMAGSEPTPTGAGNWILISDEALRGELAAADSTVLVAGVDASRVANRVKKPFNDYIDVFELGVLANGSDQTSAIQAIINANDGSGVVINLLIRRGIKFNLKNITHNTLSDLSIKYSYSDDLSEPFGGTVGDTGIEVTYNDKGISGIADNYAGGYGSAPYHPVAVLDCRSDINSPLVSTAQKQTMINGSYGIFREGRTKLQMTYRDFDRKADNTPETAAGKSGIDLAIWREIYTTTGITSASWGAPPAVGNLVETSTGKLFVVAAISGGGMTLHQRKGSLVVGDKLIFNGVESSTAIATSSRTLSSLINRFCVNSLSGAVGFNLPPERIVNANVGIGGTFGIEKGSGSVYGTAEPIFYQVDVMSAPTIGFYTRYNTSTGWWELRKASDNALMATITPSGTMQLAAVAPTAYSLTQLRTQSNAVNTDGKRQGKQVTYITNGRPVYAMGPLVTDAWQYADGTILITPDIP